MKDNPRSCSQEYYNQPEGGVYPISKLDAKILDQLEELLVELDGSKQLLNIFKAYKNSLEDETVHQMLSDLISNKNDFMDRVLESFIINQAPENEEKKKKHIIIEGYQIPAQFIKTIKQEQRYSYKKVGMEYFLVINYNEIYEGPLLNIEISFNTISHRDKTLSRLRDTLMNECEIELLFIS
jgi:hypothetical protein